MKVVSQPSIVRCYVSFREYILHFICEALPDPRAHSLLSVPRLCWGPFQDQGLLRNWCLLYPVWHSYFDAVLSSYISYAIFPILLLWYQTEHAILFLLVPLQMRTYKHTDTQRDGAHTHTEHTYTHAHTHTNKHLDSTFIAHSVLSPDPVIPFS